MLSPENNLEFVISPLVTELRRRLPSTTCLIDSAPPYGRDSEEFAAYVCLPAGPGLVDPLASVHEYEVARGLVSMLASEITERYTFLKQAEHLPLSGIGVSEPLSYTEKNPPEYEAFYGDIPKGRVPWKLSLTVFFVEAPDIEVRSLAVPAMSELAYLVEASPYYSEPEEEPEKPSFEPEG